MFLFAFILHLLYFKKDSHISQIEDKAEYLQEGK